MTPGSGRQEAIATPRLAVLACMEAGLPADHLYANQGGAHVVRNDGGAATTDAVRSLVLCREHYGIERIVVLGHTGCRLLGHARFRGVRSARSWGERQGPLDEDTDHGALSVHLATQAARLRRHPSLHNVRVDIAVYDDTSDRLLAPT